MLLLQKLFPCFISPVVSTVAAQPQICVSTNSRLVYVLCHRAELKFDNG
jgi:hypothetical protein